MNLIPSSIYNAGALRHWCAWHYFWINRHTQSEKPPCPWTEPFREI
jgi:hypothetical protein